MELPPDDLCDDIFNQVTRKKKSLKRPASACVRVEPVSLSDSKGLVQLPSDDNCLSLVFAGSTDSTAKSLGPVKKQQKPQSPVIIQLPDDDDGEEWGASAPHESKTKAMVRNRGKPRKHGLLPVVSNPSCTPLGCKEVLMEFFSPPRFVVECQARGLPATTSWDLTLGWNADNPGDRQTAWQALEDQDPWLTTLSPECTMFSITQRNCNIKKMDPVEVAQRMAVAIEHMDYCIEICFDRSRKGRVFLLEHPSTASSWNLDSVIDACQRIPGCRICSFAQCRYGLKSPSGKPMQKLTKFLTNSVAIAQEFHGKTCLCKSQGIEHQPIEGTDQGRSLSTWAQVYPKPLVKAVVDCAQQEFVSLA